MAEVVGNVSLQQGDDAGLRWRITNVGVLPEYRGRGIARTLMQETLREIARRAGAWAILQVRAGNELAHRLYLDLGFVDICRDGLGDYRLRRSHRLRLCRRFHWSRYAHSRAANGWNWRAEPGRNWRSGSRRSIRLTTR